MVGGPFFCLVGGVGSFYGQCDRWSVFCIFTGLWSVFIFENGRFMVGGSWSWSVVCGVWRVAVDGFVLSRGFLGDTYWKKIQNGYRMDTESSYHKFAAILSLQS